MGKYDNDVDALIEDSKGLNNFIDSTQKKVYGFFRKNNINNNDHDDLYFESLEIFTSKLKEPDLVLTTKPIALFWGILKRRMYKYLERKSREKVLYFDDLDIFNNSIKQNHKQEHIKILNDNINSMKKGSRDIIKYFYIDGMTMDEIAKKLNLRNTNVAKSNKYKAFKRLEKKIKLKYDKNDFFD